VWCHIFEQQVQSCHVLVCLCMQSQFSFELMWKKYSPYSTASLSSRIYIFHLYMAHTSVSTTVVYCLQLKLPTHQSANITVHCTQNKNNSTIHSCHYQYPSSNNDWLVHNELEWTWKEVVMSCLKYYCNIYLKGQRKAKENLSC